MAIDIGKFGIWRRVGEFDRTMARDIEELGYGALWIGGSPPGDLDLVERTLDATDTIPVVTGIVNMWREDPASVAASHQRIIEKHPGRFLLGVGIGHPESTDSFHNPIDKINEYLDVLDRAGVGQDQVILAALGPKVLRISAVKTIGAHPYLTTPRHTTMARRILGDGPLLAPAHFVVLGDTGTARRHGRRAVARYLELGNYRRNLLREGWDQADLDNQGSDRLIDALVLHGTPATIGEGLKAHLDEGADHVSIRVVGGDPNEAHRELAPILFG